MKYYRVVDEASDYYGRTGLYMGSINDYIKLKYADGCCEFVRDEYVKGSCQRAYEEKLVNIAAIAPTTADFPDAESYEYVEFCGYKFKRVD